MESFLQILLHMDDIIEWKERTMKKVYVVYLINDNFGFDGIVGVFEDLKIAKKTAESFNDGYSIPNIYEHVLNESKEYL